MKTAAVEAVPCLDRELLSSHLVLSACCCHLVILFETQALSLVRLCVIVTPLDVALELKHL